MDEDEWESDTCLSDKVVPRASSAEAGKASRAGKRKGSSTAENPADLNLGSDERKSPRSDSPFPCNSSSSSGGGGGGGGGGCSLKQQRVTVQGIKAGVLPLALASVDVQVKDGLPECDVDMSGALPDVFDFAEDTPGEEEDGLDSDTSPASPPLLPAGSFEEENEVEREDEEMDMGDEEKEDPVLWDSPPDPHDLIAPLPPLTPRNSLPAMMFWKEMNCFPSPYTIRHKLYAHRELVQRIARFATLNHHRGCVNALNYNPSGTLLLSGSDDMKVGIWDWQQKKLHYSFHSGHVANVFQTKFMPLSNDSLIVSTSRDGTVRLSQLSQAKAKPEMKLLYRHSRSCHKLDVRGDSAHHIMSCGEDGAVFYMDIREERARKCLLLKKKSTVECLYSIMSNPLKAHEFVISGVGKDVRVFDLRYLNADDTAAPPLLTLCPPLLNKGSTSLSVSAAIYNHTGSEILASYNDYHIFLFRNCPDEKVASVPLAQYQGHRNNQTVKGVNFYGPHSEYVVSGSDCGRVFFWEKDSQRIVHSVMGDDIGAVNVLEPHPLDPYLATSGLEHSVKIWAPLRESPADLQELIPVISKHANDRKREIRETGDPDGRFFMMLMQHLRNRGGPGVPPAPRPPSGEGAHPEEEPPVEEPESDEEGNVVQGPINCRNT